jgi:putative Mg2+ transporter-C (MgtC) family protein
MSTTLGWHEIAVRILCTLLAGILIGFDRGEHGRPAGVRTIILVSMAACLSMIQANLLLPMTGKTPESFAVMDLMRLPLGILSGMGFIGAGAILRRDNLVVGVTTAATLWFVTVLGLCFGGGQLTLGLSGLGIGMVVLTGVKSLEGALRQDRLATLSMVMSDAAPAEDEVRAQLVQGHFTIKSWASVYDPRAGTREIMCELLWRTKSDDTNIPEPIRIISGHPGLLRIAWTPHVA